MINETILKECQCKGFNENKVFGAYKLFFGTLVSESRLRIINILRKQKMNVGQIMEKLEMEQTAISHDLARLKECGFVKVEIEGKFRNYSLNKKTIGPLMKIIDEHMEDYCIHILNKGEKK